jgi:protein SCO1/2
MRAWGAALATAVLGTAVLAWATNGFGAFTAETARKQAVAEQPRPLPAVPLQLQDGSEARLRDLQGRLVVATFIYTRCQTMCPVLGMRMARIRDRLPQSALGSEVHMLSVSFDPRHDTPKRLADYGGHHGAAQDHWWVARPRANLDTLLERLGVVVLDDGSGGFNHNAAFYLIDRRGRVTAIIDDQKPEKVVRAVERRL